MAAGGVCFVFVFRNQRVDAPGGAPSPLFCHRRNKFNYNLVLRLFPLDREVYTHNPFPDFRGQRANPVGVRSGLSIASMNASCENDSLVFLSSF
jgi:hypothetical protein